MHGLNRPVTRQLPPVAQRRPAFSVHHGVELVDEYAWLRADNWQEVMRDPVGARSRDPRLPRGRERLHRSRAGRHAPSCRRTLFAEMKARIKEDDSSVPAPDGAYEYFASYVTGGQYPRLCRRPRGGGRGADPARRQQGGRGQALLAARRHRAQPRPPLLAYAVDDKGSELFTITRPRPRHRQGPARRPSPTRAARIVWGARQQDAVLRPARRQPAPAATSTATRRHAGQGRRAVYEEKDKGFFVGVGQTQSARFVIIDAHDHQTTEVYLIDADAPESEPRLVAPREHGHEYAVEHHGDSLIITTNSGGAEDFRIGEAPLADPQRSNWREIVPHKPGRLILETVAFKDHLVRLEREDGLPRIVVRRFADGAEHAIAFDEEAYSLGMSAGYEFDTTTLRFTYSSMTTPAQVYDYDMETRARVLRKTQEVPSGHDPADYVTRRLLCAGRRRRDRAGLAALPQGHAARRLRAAVPLRLRRLRHLASRRRSRPRGCRWSTAASSLPSPTSAAARTRAIAGTPTASSRRRSTPSPTSSPPASISSQEGYTRRGRIVANGGSAGGMLMGVVANMAPELFLGIIADVPFVDVLNTMLDETLPLTPPEWPEWGNPIESQGGFRDHPLLLALRQRRGQGLSAHLRLRRPHRPARDLLGAGQVGRAAAPPQHQPEPDPAEDQHGGGPRRRLRPLRGAQGAGASTTPSR